MKEGYGYFLIAVASILWGTLGVLGKMAFQYEITPSANHAEALDILLHSIVQIIVFKRELYKIKGRDIPFLVVFGLFPIALQRVAISTL